VWYLVRLEPNKEFDAGTTSWTFKIKGDPGETLDVEFAQHYFDNPS
jgi:hypothetical protein